MFYDCIYVYVYYHVYVHVCLYNLFEDTPAFRGLGFVCIRTYYNEVTM
jgi:hypothetical protein